ncbi:hypothetical protein [Streptomyces albidoflavus]|uniref:hypothetical protein n=2 Tax=Streptomyces TaxID=1883 RepID=UPI000A6CBF20|nr:hypothetical protein [Streptomyces albidoflavus]
MTATGVVVSLVTGTESAPATSSPAPAASAPAPGGQRGSVEHRVPVGYPRSEAGAKAAAVNYTTVSGSAWYLTEKAPRHRAVSVMASQPAAKAMEKHADRAAERFAGDLGGTSTKIRRKHALARTGVFSARPLAVSADEATVRLWTTTVRGSTAGSEVPKAAYQSVTVRLVWERNDWKLSGSSSGPGLVAPIDARQASNSPGDFDSYDVSAEAEDPALSGVIGSTGFPGPYARSVRGAHGAAVNAAVLYGDPRFFVDGDWRHRMLKATAAPDVLEAVTSETDTTAELVAENRGLGADGRTGDGGVLVTRTAVLGTRSISYSGQAATVELWTASVGGVAGDDESQRPQVAFLRMTVDLVRTAGTWKTTSVTPADPLVPAPPNTEAAPAERFAEVGGAGNAPSSA